MRAVQVLHRARRVSDQQARAGCLCHRNAKLIDMAILQAKLAQFLIPETLKHMFWISAPGVRNRDQHRQRHRARRNMRERGTHGFAGKHARHTAAGLFDQSC